MSCSYLYRQLLFSLQVGNQRMLSEMLPLQSGMIVALVGAGGKTTTMFRLAAELTARGKRVITTTTTHIGTPKADQPELLLLLTGEHKRWREATAEALANHQHITVAAATTAEGKLQGISPELADDLRALRDVSAILVEADGAKGRFIKAPAAHEPVIPASADLVLLLMSTEALGQ